MFGDFWVTLAKKVVKGQASRIYPRTQPSAHSFRQTPFGTEQKELYELSL